MHRKAPRSQQEAADARSGLRNTGELQKSLFNSGLLDYRFTSYVRLTMPTLVIAGDRDYAIGMEQQQEIARRVRGARIETYSGGHFMYLDEPERFTRDVVKFVTESSAPP